MNRKGQVTLGGIVILVVLIVFSIAIIPEIFNQQSVQTAKTGVTNEVINTAAGNLAGGINESYVFTITNAPTGWQATDCPITSFVLSPNSSVDYTETTDYVVNLAAGTFTLVNTSDTHHDADNSTFVDYSYCQDGYNTSAGGRSTAGLIGLFTVIGLLAVVIVKSGVLDLR